MAFIENHSIEKKLITEYKGCVVCCRSYPRVEDKLLVTMSAAHTFSPSFDSVILDLRINVVEQFVCD